MAVFPQDFLWGAATSAYQVEGNNIYSDWWKWENNSDLRHKSGLACRHYDLYKEDFDLAGALNHNAHRLSIEWSRIEPQEGNFSAEELEHYTQVIAALKDRNIEPIITLHHFSNPAWFAHRGGWVQRGSYEYFLRFVNQVVKRFKEQVHFWVTINEPLVYIYQAYILGRWPPQEKSLFKAMLVEHNLGVAHVRAYRLIHHIYQEARLPQPAVSIAKNLSAFSSCSAKFRDRLSVYLRNRLYNFGFLERLIRQKSLDFIGVNYYSRTLVEVKKWGFLNLMLDTCSHNHHPLKKNSLGWDIYPQGLYELLLALKGYNLPIFILENGICTGDDPQRWNFILQHLRSLQRARQQGLSIIGYIYWSLLDNFEWSDGFAPRFGLVEVDYQTYKRRIRESAQQYAEVCKSGVLPEEGYG